MWYIVSFIGGAIVGGSIGAVVMALVAGGRKENDYGKTMEVFYELEAGIKRRT